MLSAADLAGMASTLEASLPDTCVVVSGATVPDGRGGSKPDPAATNVTVACRISPTSTLVRNAEDVEAGRIASQAPWTITVPRDTQVSEDDRITSSGRTFEVAALFGPRSYPVGLRVFCREVR